MANIKRAATSGLTKTGTAIPDVPDAPTIGAATNVGTSRAFNNGSATVAFTAAATGGSPSSYTATSSPGGFTASGASSPLTVTGLQSATSYTFTVSGTNSTATGAVSSASNSITATTVPQAPTIGAATAGNANASVTFTANATGGSAITGYTVTSSPGSITGTGSSSPITVSGLTNDTAYTFTVTATNANGTSAASSASNSVTPIEPGAFVQIASFTGNGSATTITFSSIPQSYKHLVLRYSCRATSSSGYLFFRVNGISANSYSQTNLGFRNNAAVTSSIAELSRIYASGNTGAVNLRTGAGNNGEITIPGYSNSSNGYKVLRGWGGIIDTQSESESLLIAGNDWGNTAAVTELTVNSSSSAFTTTSTFTLYGVS